MSNNSDFPGPSASPQPPAPTQAEPVAWMRPDNRVAEESTARTQFSRGAQKPPIGTWVPLYATPPAPASEAPTQAQRIADYHAWCGSIDDESTLRRAASVMQDVLTDIEDWEDTALAEAVAESRNEVLALAESIAAFPAAPTQAGGCQASGGPLYLVHAGGDGYQAAIVPESQLDDAYLLTQWVSLDDIDDQQRADALAHFHDDDSWTHEDASGQGRRISFSLSLEDGWVSVVRLPAFAPPAGRTLTAPTQAGGCQASDDGEDFETWWERSGQFSRAGGGGYEKTFAFNAWHARKAPPAGRTLTDWRVRCQLIERQASAALAIGEPAHVRNTLEIVADDLSRLLSEAYAASSTTAGTQPSEGE